MPSARQTANQQERTLCLLTTQHLHSHGPHGHGADLLEVMKGSGQGLMQQIASTVAAAQVSRSSQTVGTRFRDQLKDLISRLDQSVSTLLQLCAVMLGVVLSPWSAIALAPFLRGCCSTACMMQHDLQSSQACPMAKQNFVLQVSCCRR